VPINSNNPRRIMASLPLLIKQERLSRAILALADCIDGAAGAASWNLAHAGNPSRTHKSSNRHKERAWNILPSP
jgi:hypothetical protein